MAGHASSVSALHPRRTLPELFYLLPTETQQDILSHLDSRPHLSSLSLSSCHLYSLCSERLHQEISFDCLTPESAITSYNEHTGPRHGRLCKTLKLAFSLGPLISRKSDQYRASLFSKVLQHTKLSLTHLEINTAGSDLRDVENTLQTIIHGGLRQLRSLTLKICDLQEHEIHTLSTFFYHLSRSSLCLPNVRINRRNVKSDNLLSAFCLLCTISSFLLLTAATASGSTFERRWQQILQMSTMRLSRDLGPASSTPSLQQTYHASPC